MRANIQLQRLALLAAIALAAACARSVAVESEPGPAYTIQVDNPMPHPMIVFYSGGVRERLLGTVAAGGETPFVITAPASTAVTVVARDENGAHEVRRQVTLRAGTPVRITLQ
jgi:hypothetical protein